jgi:uncharacterized membrane protein YccC
MVAAGAIALAGVASHNLPSVALMFFGAACAVAFVGSGSHRTRLIAVAAQGLGAAAGLGFGAIGATSGVGRVVIAAVAGLVSGWLGAIGIAATAFALMAVIGVAYEQFGGIALPWQEKAGWYLLGTVVVSAFAILPLPARRVAYARAAVANVYVAAADLLEAIGTPTAAARRRDLAAASSVSRDAMAGRLLVSRRLRSAWTLLRVQFVGSQQVAFAAAALYSEAVATEPRAAADVRDAARSVRDGLAYRIGARSANSVWLQELSAGLEVAAGARAADEPVAPRLWGRLRVAAQAATRPSAWSAGLRLAWCMAIATLVTNALHQSSHSYWLPLTVAVVVRPEYASVFVRTVNRVIGTISGALLAAIALLALPSGGIVAVAATLFVGWAVLSAPKLYALSVIGITGSALLSASIGSDDPVYPALRLLDTLVGCAIAIIFGYLLWPGRGSRPFAVGPERAATDAVAYLRAAAAATSARTDWPQVRDRAYVSVHRYRAAVQAALSDPPPVSTAAAGALATAVALEDFVDGVSALDAVTRGGRQASPASVDSLAQLVTAMVSGMAEADPDEVIARVGRLAAAGAEVDAEAD